MPMVRRTVDGVDRGAVDVLVVQQDLALGLRAPGVTSCMRLIERSTVDLPQPEGPMNAVTLFGSMVRMTLSTAWKSP